MGIYDKSGKLRLVYSAPVVRLPSGKTATLDLDWDPSASSISVTLPELSFPLVIAFGLGLKFPDTKGGFHLAFPSFKFGAKGEIEDSDSSDSDDEKKAKKSGGFGFGIKAPKFGAKGEVKGEIKGSDSSDSDDEKKEKHSGGYGIGIKAPKFGFGHAEKPEVEKPKVEASVAVSAEKPKHKVTPLSYKYSCYDF